MSMGHSDFRELVMTLFSDGKNYLNQNRSIANLIPCSRIKWHDKETVLSQLLDKTVGDLGGSVLPLSAPSGHNPLLVGLWCNWDFSNQIPFCKIEVLIFQAQNQVYGFRIDPPHSQGQKHNYWHAQFTHRFERQNLYFPSSNATWISHKTPAYPIPLQDPGNVAPRDAAVYAVLSLYGKDIPPSILANIRKIQTLDTSLRHIVGS